MAGRHTAGKYSNLTVQHRPHATVTDPRPAPTTDIDVRATSSHRGTGCRDHQAGAVKRTANAAARSAASCIAVRSVLAGLGADNAPSRSAAWSATSCIEVRLVLAGLGAENAASRSAASSRAAQV